MLQTMFSSPSKDTSPRKERTSSIDKTSSSSLSSPTNTNSPTNATRRWSIVRDKVSTISKKDLENEVLNNINNPNPASVMKLGHICLEQAFERNASNRKKLVHVGVLLMEWSLRHNIELSNNEVKLLAKGHYEYWLLSGCECEEYNLLRSKDLYEQCFKHLENVGNHNLLIDFCRVLQHSGEEERASQIAMEIVKTFEHSPDYANYLFYTGCLYKSLGMHDLASTYLFESIQQGPPKFFSKLDMMFLISRNIEENSKQRGENCDDAYRMVYDHEKLDGHIDDELDYDRWINNSDTWRILGDKCTLHGVYSIARDLYGQGLLRDETSFLKPKLWFSFAKSCYRCGKTSDAQLAIKQALTMDSFNKQLISTIKNWSNPRHYFEAKINEGMVEILKNLPPDIDHVNKAATRIQACFKSYKAKKDVSLGLGKKKHDRGTFVSSRMRSNVGIMLGNFITWFILIIIFNIITIIGEKYPLVIEVFADWGGCIKSLLFHDIHNNTTSKLKLHRPFMPNLQMGPPRPLRALLMIKRSSQDQAKANEMTIIIRFLDRKTGTYNPYKLLYNYTNNDDTTLAEYLEKEIRVKYDILVDKPDDQNDQSICIPLPDAKYLSLQLQHDDIQVSTSIVDIEISK